MTIKLLPLFFLFIYSTLFSQTIRIKNTTDLVGEEWTKKKAQKWFDEKEWLNDLKLKPHSTINIQEFAKQYHSNKARWDLAFAYLGMANLDTLKAGKYSLDGDNVYITVTNVNTIFTIVIMAMVSGILMILLM